MQRTCGRCGLVKPLENFAWRRTKKIRDNYCRPCRAAYHREHYLKNKERYIKNAGDRRRRVVEERTAYLLDYFRTHPCEDCGERDPVVLEFDHRGQKDFHVTAGIRDRNWEAVLAEIAKCDVVCANCHRRRTSRRAGSVRSRLALEGGSSSGGKTTLF